jgi:hypothetical protein
LRYIAALLLTVVLFSSHAYADNPGQLGIKMNPGIITQNTEGLIQVYSKSGGTIDKLIATSYDPSVVKITGIDQDASHTVYIVKIKTQKSGDTKIAFAAPGFSSEEFPVKVTKNTVLASKLLIKTTPSTFDTNGPKHGYFSVEAVNGDGFPTIMTDDTQVTITVSDANIVNLKENQVVMKKGSYFAVGEFDVKQPGSVTISASSQSMQAVSTSITVGNTLSENTVQVYVFPTKINAFSASYTYAIVQLHDSSGTPVIAKEDIPITIHVTNSTSSDTVNTSGDSPYVQVNERPIIKKGSYWAYVPVELTAETSSTFNVAISAKGYLVSPAAQFSSVNIPLVFADDSARVDILPILASGNKELVGIAHLEDSSGNILVAKDNLDIHVDSSDLSTLSVSNVVLNHGTQAELVFAQVGKVVNPVTLNVVAAQPQQISPTLLAPTIKSLTLVAEPLIGKILSHSYFPLAFYLTNNGALYPFDSNFDLNIGPVESVQTGPASVTKDSLVKIVNSTLLQDGVQSFSVTGSTYSQSFTMEGLSSYPKSIMMDFPYTITSNTLNAFSIELLDAQNLPVYADYNVTVKLVSNDPSIIDFPDVQIKKGTYYTMFNVQAKKSGSAGISLLADRIPLSKFSVSVVSFTPDVSIQSPDFSESTLPFVAKIIATYKQAPLEGLKVEWSAEGATIQKMNSTTNLDGTAMATFLSTAPGDVIITAKVSGGSYEDVVVTKDVKINASLSSEKGSLQSKDNTTSFSIMGISPILLIIPIVAGVIGFLFFKKREMLEGIAEKMSEIKEKMTNLRQRD